MMQSSYGGNSGDEDEEDLFAPNPFRGGEQQQQPGMQMQPGTMNQQMQSGMTNPQMQQQYPSMMQQQQQQQQHPGMMTNNNNAGIPDPGSGMTGTYSLPPPAPTAQPVHYLSGTMDQQQSMAATSSSYGGTNYAPNPNYNNPNYNNPNNQQDNTTPTGSSSFLSWVCCMSCLRLETYQVYFDMDTNDITARLKAALIDFYRPDYFRLQIVGDPNVPSDDGTNDSTLLHKGPDLYGPMWISMTLVFCLAVTSNMAAYYEHFRSVSQSSHKNSAVTPTNSSNYVPPAAVEVEEFEYDLNHLIRALTIVTVFSFGLPTAYWMATKCMGISQGVSWDLWICVYGYSLVPFVVACGILWFPFSFIQWLVLAAAATASCLLVLRNLVTPLLQQDEANHAKAGPIVLAILVTHFIFFVVVKVTFFK
jgi:hypothetical protein